MNARKLKKMETRLCVAFFAILLGFQDVSAFYIPGVAPVEYVTGDALAVKAVKLTSTQTQLPYEFYSLPICKPPEGRIAYASENSGEVLRGDRIESTPYLVEMRVNKSCAVLCSHVNEGKPLTWTAEESGKVVDLIKTEYSVHLLMDNLPAATRLYTEAGMPQFQIGYQLGSHPKGSSNEVVLNNYLKLHLKYHTDNTKTHRFVGFEVEARSRDVGGFKEGDKAGECKLTDGDAPPLKLVAGNENKVQFYYSIEWQESPVRWASRWDVFLNMSDVQIHWFSIFNSLVFIFFLSGVVTMILVRTLRRDIARYNEGDPETLDDVMEETGWKLVHGDVFRLPRYPRLFVAIVGSGIQILCMTMITLFFAMLGMLSPASRGALMTAAIFLYVFMGCVAGYYSARLYKTMKGTQWKRAAFLTSTLYPGFVFGTGFILNFFVIAKKSSGAVPFSTMLSLLCLWFGISVPLVYLGYYFGFRKPPFQNPVRTNQIPRQIPPRRWYMNPVFSALVAGVLPFGAMFIELFFVFTAIWENQVYYLFGFLFVVFLILVISCAQISVLMVYFQLCAEDYHWWWRSLLVSGGSAVYVFLYAVFYFMNKLEITDFVSTILYFGYTLIMVVTFAFMTGTVGFVSAYAFVRKIYGAVKID